MPGVGKAYLDVSQAKWYSGDSGDIQDIPGDIQDIPGDIQAHLAVSQASRQAGLLSWRERFDSSHVGRRWGRSRNPWYQQQGDEDAK